MDGIEFGNAGDDVVEFNTVGGVQDGISDIVDLVQIDDITSGELVIDDGYTAEPEIDNQGVYVDPEAYIIDNKAGTPLDSLPQTHTYQYDDMVSGDTYGLNDYTDILVSDPVDENTESNNNQTYDDKNILLSLSTIREGIKLNNQLETENTSEVVILLEDIKDNINYTNYLLAVVIGIVVIKTIFDKVLP